MCVCVCVCACVCVTKQLYYPSFNSLPHFLSLLSRANNDYVSDRAHKKVVMNQTVYCSNHKRGCVWCDKLLLYEVLLFALSAYLCVHVFIILSVGTYQGMPV